ncbi:hypothetical protein KDL44_00845 [bacterium]|nr:hypothetical protein [bacterium]
MRILIITALACILPVLACGCGRIPAPVIRQDTAETTLQEQLPPVPEDRASSLAMSASQSGTEYVMQSGTAIDLGSGRLGMDAAAGLIWAWWQFAIPANEYLTEFSFSLDQQAGETYIAVANHAAGRWDISGGFSGTQAVSLDDAVHRSALDNCHVAVLVPAGSSFAVNSIELHTDYRGWLVTEVIDDVQFDSSPSLAEIDGRPAIVHGDFTLQTTIYSISNTAEVVSDGNWQSYLLDNLTAAGVHELQVVDGRPAVFYKDIAGNSLRMASSPLVDGRDGESWTAVKIADAPISVTPRYMEVLGKPVVVFANAAGIALARSSTAGGLDAGDWSSTQIHSGPSFSFSAAMIAGRPALAFRDFNSNQCQYVISSTDDGASAADWQNLVQLTDSNESGLAIRLLGAGGRPAVSYLDLASDNYVWLRSETATGESVNDWQSAVQLPGSFGGIQDVIDALYLDGELLLAMNIDAGSNPAVLRSADPAGADGSWAAERVHPVNFGSVQQMDMAVIAGRPCIAYLDYDNKVLYCAMYYGVE